MQFKEAVREIKQRLNIVDIVRRYEEVTEYIINHSFPVDIASKEKHIVGGKLIGKFLRKKYCETFEQMTQFRECDFHKFETSEGL